LAENFTPAYLKLGSRALRARGDQLAEMASPCRLCPRECGALRKEGETGYCRTGFAPMVSSIHPHFGEEACLVGKGGSGTVFLTNCSLGCLFCQNSDISHLGKGRSITIQELADSLMALQDLGCHNINFVTPSHQVHAIVKAIALAAERGLTLPLVYNTGGYDPVPTLGLLDGIFDIYMPDLKFTGTGPAMTLADAPDYPDAVKRAILEMHRQVGDLVLDKRGIAVRGLLVRHLVLPSGLAGSDEAFRFLAEKVSRDTWLNVMAQYRPCYRAAEIPAIGRLLDRQEYLAALSLARKHGLGRLD